MPTYDYKCEKCNITTEVIHSIKSEHIEKCTKCKKPMEKIIGLGSGIITGGLNGTRQEHKSKDRIKKVKDFERAVKNRKKHFGTEAVGNPNDTPNPKHIIKKGKALGGQQMDVDKRELTKALAKDDLAVSKAREAISKIKK